MKFSFYPFFLFIFFAGVSDLSLASGNPSAETVKSSREIKFQEDYAHLYILYPDCKSCNSRQVFLNKKNIAKLKNGGRLECSLLIEGSVAITLIEGLNYIEPLTQSKNSRTITVKKGKSYYFRVSNSGGLEYIMSADKGQKDYNNSSEFTATPVSFTEVTFSPIPPIQ